MYNKIKLTLLKPTSNKTKITSSSLKVVVLATYAALVYALQIALSFLPNVEVVTFMISLSALIFTWYYAIGISIVFCCLEMISGGLGPWELTYFVVWPMLVLITYAFKSSINKQWWIFIVINSLFGFLFGSFDTLMNMLIYGKQTALVYWMNGWIFDAIHGVSNFIVAFVLYKPVKEVTDKTLKKYLF